MLLADLKKVEGSLSSDATLSFIKDLSEMQRLTEFCINDCTSSSQIRLSNNLENLHDLLPKAPNLQEFCISRLTENQSYDLTCSCSYVTEKKYYYKIKKMEYWEIVYSKSNKWRLYSEQSEFMYHN